MSHSYTWIILFPLIASIVAFARSRYATSQSDVERWFGAAVVTLAGSSLLMVGLLSLRLFTPRALLLCHAALAISATCIIKPSWRFSMTGRPSPRYVAASILVILATIFFRLKPASHLYGGQDPGVYTNAGNYIAQHGTRFYTDTTLPIVRDDPKLFNYYLKSTYLHVGRKPNGPWYGNLSGGLYIHDLTKGESVFQFYPGTEIWLALGSLLFGPHQSTWIFLPFSILTVIAVGLLTHRLTKSLGSAFSASFLLAINPAHASISTSPLSEALACFFFLSGLYFLVNALHRERRVVSGYALSISALAFGCLFFTRITGFLTLPLILTSVLPMAAAIRAKRVRILLATYGIGCSALYILSFFWGMIFTRHYSRDIFRSKLGISPQSLVYIPYALCLGILVWSLLLLTTSRWGIIRRVMRRHRNYIGWVVVGVILVVVSWKGYQLGFTDTYANHRWFSRRWHMAGKGWQSVIFMGISSLSLIMSPPGLLIGLCGVAFTFRRALTTSTWIPVCVLATCFLTVLTLKPLTVPYLYYFARYQVSELLPLLIVTGVCFLHHLIYRSSKRTQALTWAIHIIACCSFLVRPALARLKETEGLLFSQAMACIDALSSEKTIIAVDKADLLVSPIVTPLRLTYGKKTIGFNESHFPDESSLRGFFEFFAKQGYDLIVLSASERWSSSPLFTEIIRMRARMRKLDVVKGEYRLPHTYSDGVYPIRLYRYLKEGEVNSTNGTEIPAACEDFR